MSDHFYLTLPSNSSSGIFPDNKITHFKTQLCNRISLQGNWEIGLSEIHYPNSFLTISDKDFWIGYEFDLKSLPVPSDESEQEFLGEGLEEKGGFQESRHGREIGSVIDPEGRGKMYFQGGNFTSIESLVRIIQNNTNFSSVAKISVFQERIQINLQDHVKRLVLSLPLQKIFNLEGVELNQQFIDAPNECNLEACMPTQMFIYSDLIMPQNVGDVLAPLLRIVNIDKSRSAFGNQKVMIFTHPHYVPLLRREFQQVEIDIRDDLGYYLPFTSGRLNVKLHFRKIS